MENHFNKFIKHAFTLLTNANILCSRLMRMLNEAGKSFKISFNIYVNLLNLLRHKNPTTGSFD